MPAPSLRFVSPAWRHVTAGLCLAGLMPMAHAAEVLIITDSRHPVQAPTGVRIVELDAPARLEAELAAGLPVDPERAAAIVRQRLQDGGTGLQRLLADAYQGVTDAWSLSITKIPAVVVDQRYVVYGEPDVAHAVARIEAYRGRQP